MIQARPTIGVRVNTKTGKAPEYPGYKAPECNGCGLCCLTVPCAVSGQFGLWKDGRCRALRFAAGRYRCDAIINPRRVSVRLARHKKAIIVGAMGAGEGCDHRAAGSVAGSLESLARRNLLDEIENNKTDTYPRACCYHRPDGTTWVVRIDSPDTPPTIQQCVDGLPVGAREPIEP